MQILSNPGKQIFVGVRGLKAGVVRLAGAIVRSAWRDFRFGHLLMEGCLVAGDEV